MDLDYNPSRKYLFIKNKWVSTAASIWIQCTSGSLYTFSVYSPILKSSQGYTQSTLDTISVFKDLGGNVGILSGLLYSAAADHGFGPWLVHLAGAVQCFLGYFLIWATVVGKIPQPPIAVMCIYMLIAAHAMTFFNTANVVTGVHNFPNYRGVIVGIMQGFLGLSGAVLIQVYQTIFKSHPSSYLLLLALLPSINAVILMRFVRAFVTNEEDEKKYLNRFSFLAVLLATYLAVVIVIQHMVKLNLSVRIITFVLLILFVLSPIVVAIEAQQQRSYRMVKSLLEQNQIWGERERPLIDEASSSNREGNGVDDHDDDLLHWREDQTLLQSMKSLNFWFLFYTTACAMGSGLATVNNISQIGESLGYTSLETNTLVSLWSIWNFLGRFGAGYVSDTFLHIKGCPRPVFVVMTLAAMSIGHALVASGVQGSLYVGSVLIGICYGSQWSLMPTIASEIFGKTHMGTIFNTITIAGPIGSYLLSVKVVGYIYDREAGADHGKGSCTGTRCFMLSFIIMASVTFSGFIIALILLIRTRKFYKNVVLRKILLHSRSGINAYVT